MKKQIFYLFFVFSPGLTLLNAQTFVSTTPSNKNAIIEEYTGITCGNCPDGHRIAQEITGTNPGKAFVINIHQGSFAPNNPNYKTSFGNSLADQAGVNSWPAGTVNRHVFIGNITNLNRGFWSRYSSQVIAEPSYVNVAAKSTIDYDTRELTVNVEIYYTGTSSESLNKLNVALLQNNILGPQSGMGYNPSQVIDGMYNHMHMLRHLITGQWGDDITDTAEGSFIEKSYTYTIPDNINGIDCDLENMEVIVFVAEGRQEIITGTKAEMIYKSFESPKLIRPTGDIEDYNCGYDALIYTTIMNYTEDNITSVQYTYSFDEEIYTIVENDLDIAPSTTGIIQLPAIPLIEGEDKTVEILLEKFNNNVCNSSITKEIRKRRVASGSGNMIFNLKTDRYGSETTFKFFDNEGNVVLEGGPFADSQSRVYSFEFNPESIGCYKLEVYDPDGINGGYGEGYFNLTDELSNVIIDDDGKFAVQANYYIDVVDPSSIREAGYNTSVSIYPNPVYNELLINTDEVIEEINVYNLQGQLVISNKNNSEKIPVSHLRQGVYILKIKTAKGITIHKFVKQ